MAELIDRAALLAEYDRVHVGAPGGARALIANAPTVDAAPVVRCKDCKRARECKEKHEVFCDLIAAYMGLNDYCSYGERKDNELVER